MTGTLPTTPLLRIGDVSCRSIFKAMNDPVNILGIDDYNEKAQEIITLLSGYSLTQVQATFKIIDSMLPMQCAILPSEHSVSSLSRLPVGDALLIQCSAH